MTFHLVANSISMKVRDYSGPQFTLVDDHGTVYSLDLSHPPQYVPDANLPTVLQLRGAIFKSGNEEVEVRNITLLMSDGSDAFIRFSEIEAILTAGGGATDNDTVNPAKIIEGHAAGHAEISIFMAGRPDLDKSATRISVDVAEADYLVQFKPQAGALYPCKPFRIDFSLSIAGQQVFSTDDLSSTLCAEVSKAILLSGGEGWQYANILAHADNTCSVGDWIQGLKLTLAPELSDGILKAYSPLDGKSAVSAGARKPLWPSYPNFVALKPGQQISVQVFKEPAGPIWGTKIDILPAAVKIAAANVQSLVLGEESANLQTDSMGKYQLISDVPALTLTVVDKNSGQPIQSFQTITLGHFVVDADYRIEVGKVTFENIKVWTKGNSVLEKIPYSVELLIVPASTTQPAVISFIQDPFSPTGNQDQDRVWAWIHMLVKAEAVGSATIKVTVKPDPNDPCQLSDSPTQPLGTFQLPVTVVPPLSVALARYVPGSNLETDSVLDPDFNSYTTASPVIEKDLPTTIKTIYPTGKILGRVIGWSNNSKSQKLRLIINGKETVLVDQEKNLVNPAFTWINPGTGDFQVTLSNQLALKVGQNNIRLEATKPVNRVFGGKSTPGDSYTTFAVEGLPPTGAITSVTNDPFADFFEVKGHVENIEAASLLLIDPTGGLINNEMIQTNGPFSFRWQLTKGTPGNYLVRLYGKNPINNQTSSMTHFETKTVKRSKPTLTVQYNGRVEQSGFQKQEPPSHELAVFDILADDQRATFHYEENQQSKPLNVIGGAARLTFNLKLDASNSYKFSASNFFGQVTWETIIERILIISSDFMFNPPPIWRPPVEVMAWVTTNETNEAQYRYTWTTTYQLHGSYTYNGYNYYNPLVVIIPEKTQGRTIHIMMFGATQTSGELLATFKLTTNYFGKTKTQSFNVYTYFE